MIMIEWKVVKKNRYGHRWIEEPVERTAFRKKCKHRDRFGGCALNYYCHEMDGKALCFLAGCTPNVGCPRLARWDKRNGIQQPYTIVQNSKEAARDAAIKAEMERRFMEPTIVKED